MEGAEACAAVRNHTRMRIHKLLKRLDIFIVDLLNVIRTKVALLHGNSSKCEVQRAKLKYQSDIRLALATWHFFFTSKMVYLLG